MADRGSLSRASGRGATFSGLGPALTHRDPDIALAMQFLNELLASKFGANSPLLERIPTWKDLADAGLLGVALADGKTYGHLPADGGFPSVSALISSQDKTRYLSMDGHDGYLLKTPTVGIREDGKTELSSVVGQQVFTFSPAQQWDKTGGSTSHFGAGRWDGDWKGFEFATDMFVDNPIDNRSVYDVKARLTSGAANAGTAGQFEFDAQIRSELVLSDPWFRTGSTPQLNTDPVTNRDGDARAFIVFKARPAGVIDARTSVSMTTIEFTVLQVT